MRGNKARERKGDACQSGYAWAFGLGRFDFALFVCTWFCPVVRDRPTGSTYLRAKVGSVNADPKVVVAGLRVPAALQIHLVPKSARYCGVGMNSFCWVFWRVLLRNGHSSPRRAGLFCLWTGGVHKHCWSSPGRGSECLANQNGVVWMFRVSNRSCVVVFDFRADSLLGLGAGHGEARCAYLVAFFKKSLTGVSGLPTVGVPTLPVFVAG